MTTKNKPIIETMINTTALAMTSFAVVLLTKSDGTWENTLRGFLLLVIGMGLEYIKYKGRKKKLW